MRMTRRQALGALAGAGLALGASPRLFAGERAPASFELPPLPYPYDALEPHIDAETMRLHHDKHHAGYVAKLNAALSEAPALGGRSVEELVRDLERVPVALRGAVRDHGGGHANHSLFWTSMKPGGASPPEGDLASALAGAFGSFASFADAFRTASAGVFGSGWGWLVAAPGGGLALASTPNQDSPLAAGQIPLLGVDVWEHAYYLKYQNRRAEYLAAWMNVVDWGEVGRRFTRARA